MLGARTNPTPPRALEQLLAMDVWASSRLRASHVRDAPVLAGDPT